MMLDLTAAERRVIELLREIKQGTGHGTLTVDIVDRAEALFIQAPKEKAPREKTGY